MEALFFSQNVDCKSFDHRHQFQDADKEGSTCRKLYHQNALYMQGRLEREYLCQALS